MIITLLILVVCLIVAIIAIMNLTKQVETLEDALENSSVSENYYRDIIDRMREKVLRTQVRMKETDIRGSFEADDEVGYTFKALQSIIDELNEDVNKAYESDK
jgi:predicted Holliday junction resolvase-like endonuclease